MQILKKNSPHNNLSLFQQNKQKVSNTQNLDFLPLIRPKDGCEMVDVNLIMPYNLDFCIKILFFKNLKFADNIKDYRKIKNEFQ